MTRSARRYNPAQKVSHILPSGLDHFTVVTDHNPLVPPSSHTDSTRSRTPACNAFCTQLMAYNFTAQWLKSTRNKAADALSHHPCSTPSTADDLTEYETDCNLVPSMAPSVTQIRIFTSLQQDIESLHLHELRRHAADD